VSSSSNGGELPEFTVGTYNADFENVAFSLKNTGDISVPIHTEYGYHILKLLEAKSPPANLNDPVVFTTYRDKVLSDGRLEASKKELIQKKLALIKYQPAKIKQEDLAVFTDSALQKQRLPAVKGINENTVLFSFAKKTVRAADWVKFVKSNQNASFSKDAEGYKKLYKEFVTVLAEDYYRNHLETYNADFANQVKEFKEANLLFGIMEKNVWGKANTDTAALLQYYNQHTSKYMWPASADALIVTCNNENLAKAIQQKLKDNFSDWREITSANGTEVVADSGRFELSQLATLDKIGLAAGRITVPVKNQNEGSYTFSCIIKVYNEPSQRSFEDARGMVITDYQQVLEDKWLNELKRKYPVKVNEQVFQTIK
jgi:peptidyl-prolyl cis-trans isomerase SurA